MVLKPTDWHASLISCIGLFFWEVVNHALGCPAQFLYVPEWSPENSGLAAAERADNQADIPVLTFDWNFSLERNTQPFRDGTIEDGPELFYSRR